MRSNINSVSIIGAGNVASHLAMKFSKAGLQIHTVYSRTIKNAKHLCDLTGGFPTDNLDDFRDADLVIISVPDDIVPQIASKISSNGIVVHTSGSVMMKTLNDISDRHGIFYPLQTLSKTNMDSTIEIPILIEGANKEIEQILIKLANRISDNTGILDSIARKKIHVGAVVVNNLTNHLFTLAKEYCDFNKLDFDLLKPLISETAKKINNVSPKDAQTGPAARKDLKTIENHIDLLKSNKDLQAIYQLITNDILRRNK